MPGSLVELFVELLGTSQIRVEFLNAVAVECQQRFILLNHQLEEFASHSLEVLSHAVDGHVGKCESLTASNNLNAVKSLAE